MTPVLRSIFSKSQRYFPLENCRAKLEIRQISSEDIRKIKGLVRPSHCRTLHDELEDQNKGLISIIVAWADKVPCGYSFISWEGARDPVVRRLVPGVPEFYRLTVVESARSKGIGTELIHFIEAMAHDRGIAKMGLGVAHTNTRAHTLYQRLGYEDVVEEYCDRYTYLAPEGQLKEAADKCRFMVKSLNT